WVVLLGYSPDALPQEFEMLESVNYKLDDPRNPKVIEFSTPRGAEGFVQGLTMMKILSFSQDSFTTRSIGSDEEIRWDREQTHRYFLTFAARSAVSQSQGAAVSQSQEGPAFVMWTSMDGRQTNIDALGTQIQTDSEGRSVPVFSEIAQQLYEQIR